jgi:hypothetical protein
MFHKYLKPVFISQIPRVPGLLCSKFQRLVITTEKSTSVTLSVLIIVVQKKENMCQFGEEHQLCVCGEGGISSRAKNSIPELKGIFAKSKKKLVKGIFFILLQFFYFSLVINYLCILLISYLTN